MDFLKWWYPKTMIWGVLECFGVSPFKETLIYTYMYGSLSQYMFLDMYGLERAVNRTQKHVHTITVRM